MPTYFYIFARCRIVYNVNNISSKSYHGETSVNASTLTTLNFCSPEGTIAAGGWIKVYGLKK